MAMSQKKWQVALFWAESAVEVSGPHANSLEAWEVIVEAQQRMGMKGIQARQERFCAVLGRVRW